MRRTWTMEEDARLREIVGICGPRNWAMVASMMGTRKDWQCRERWQNKLSQHVSSSPWTPQEDAVLLDAVQRVGQSWALMKPLLPGRSGHSIKNRYHSLSRRRRNRRAIGGGDSSDTEQPKADATPLQTPLPVQAAVPATGALGATGGVLMQPNYVQAVPVGANRSAAAAPVVVNGGAGGIPALPMPVGSAAQATPQIIPARQVVPMSTAPVAAAPVSGTHNAKAPLVMATPMPAMAVPTQAVQTAPQTAQAMPWIQPAHAATAAPYYAVSA